jgi:PAS domain S-box-containing protein
MKSKKKLLISIGVISQAVILLCMFFTTKYFILGNFGKIESDAVRQDMYRVKEALSTLYENMQTQVIDWAEWDDAYDFISNGNPDFIRKNLPAKTFTDLKVDVIIFARPDGRVIFGKMYDHDNDTIAPVSRSLRRYLKPGGQLLDPGRNGTGLLLLPEGPMLISARPILTTRGEGPSRGTVIMGRHLDAAAVSKLGRMTHVRLKFYRVNTAHVPADIKKAFAAAAGNDLVFVRNIDKDTIAGYGIIKDVFGKPILVAHVDMPRDIYNNGRKTVLYFIFWIMGLFVASLSIVLALYNKLLRSEKERRESIESYRAVIRQASDGFLLIDPETGKVLETNAALRNLLAYSEEELVGMPVYDLMHKEQADNADISPPLTTGNNPAFRGERLYRRKNGSPVDVDINSSLIFHNNKHVACITVRDITARKRLTDRLARLNECFLSFTADPDENIRLITALCGEIMGAACALYNRLDLGMLCTRAQWNAPPDYTYIDKPDGHLCADVISLDRDEAFVVRNLPETPYAMSDRNVGLYNLQTYIGVPVKCKDEHVGSICVVYQHDYPVTDNDKKFMGILASAIGIEEERRQSAEALRRSNEEMEIRVRERTEELFAANEQLRIDIEERRQAEEALRKSQTLLHEVFEANTDLLAVIDRDLRVVLSNWHGGYEYVPQEIRDEKPKCYQAFCQGQDKPCNSCYAMEVFRTGKPVLSEQFNARIGYIEIRTYPVFDESGQVFLVVKHIRDITARKKMEEEILKARKIESLGVLAGGIAHDFNNLLTGTLANISLAKMLLGPGEKAFARLCEAEKASMRAKDLTQQLLTFSRGGAPVKKTTDIRQIVKDSTSFALRGSNVKCEFSFAADLWPVEADEGQMGQVVNNLIINADQSMPDGGMVRVRAENVVIGPDDALPVAKGNYVRISVIDQGMGIQEENLPKIFDPYFTTKSMGSGLGLATVYSIMKNHDGHITVESTTDTGTIFHLYIPASRKALPPDGLPAAERKPPNGSGRVLVMDDEEVIRDVAHEILGHLGYHVDVCGDGAEAVTMYRNALESQDPFSAVIMDLTVPGGMGGKEAMKILLEIDPDAKGIVSSGYSNDPVVADYRKFGFCGVVAKPYRVQDLSETLQGIR